MNFKIVLVQPHSLTAPPACTSPAIFQFHSSKLYEKFNAGKLGDDCEYIKWYAYKDTLNKLMERSKEI